MRNIIRFQITKGENQYTASGIDFAIITQGQTLDELMKNIEESTRLYFDTEKMSSYNLSETPSVLVDYEIPMMEMTA